ncbi:hypothetical protein [Paraburkholderia terricola]|uniref:hypothetical protein n=1 Tax=Paraburkholderia terricola TaxID=169427 RepID=UPI003ED15C31
MTRVRFEEVSIKRTFRWRDPVTGKPRQETKKFWQTVNPFNIGADGSPKTRGAIMLELEQQARLWLLRKENDARDAAQRNTA